ncbi:MAG: substrate-binding domain-containing protein [Gammaproteobacteria bacterium]
MDIHFDLRWYFGNESPEEITVELFRLLNAIQVGGSLRAAARECGLSYRHAWGLLQKWERLSGHPFAILERGKGAVLTPLGEKLIQEHTRILADLQPQLSSLSTELAAELGKVLGKGKKTPLRVCASHGMAVALLRDLARQRFQFALDLKFHGSLDSLELFKAGRCEMAGFHLPEGRAGARFVPRIGRCLDTDNDVLIYAVRRRQGLMAAGDNPYAIRNLRDLAEKPIRFVNRQPNSGTRITFDYLLEDARIHPERIRGYHDEEFTHLAVAAMVASGAADCAFGVEEAARQFSLHFIPFNWEAYWFSVARERLKTPVVSDFLRILRSPEFQEGVADLSGYEATRAGTVVLPDPDLNALLL